MRYLYNLADGHEESRRTIMRAGRLSGVIALLAHAKEDTVINPVDIYRFPWEKDSGSKPKLEWTPETMEMLRKFHEETTNPNTWGEVQTLNAEDLK